MKLLALLIPLALTGMTGTVLADAPPPAARRIEVAVTKRGFDPDTITVPAHKPVTLVFTPHLTPIIRGIHATLYARLTDASVDLQALFEKRYAAEAFVDVMPPGSHPDTRSVRAANTCRIAVHRPQGGDTLVVLSVIDNLTKGASGQAVQNMNLMFGLDESLGLRQVPILP